MCNFSDRDILCCVAGLCVKCNKPVYGANQACQAMGSLYHDSCFTCSACSKYSHTRTHNTHTICLNKVYSNTFTSSPWLFHMLRSCQLQTYRLPNTLFSQTEAVLRLQLLTARAKKHNYSGITVLCRWCLVSGCASHSSSPHKDTDLIHTLHN